MRGFNVDRELGSNCIIGWNHQEFEVPYHCLSEEIKIGKVVILYSDLYVPLLSMSSQGIDQGAHPSGKSQGNLGFLQGQGKVREFCKMVREIRKISKVREKSGNFKIMLG